MPLIRSRNFGGRERSIGRTGEWRHRDSKTRGPRIHRQPALPRSRRQQTGRPRPPTDGDIAYLEAELSTLSKPVKVLNNLVRAAKKDRETIFVVETGNAAKLKNIVDDPKNQRGNKYEDENGGYSYYTLDGEPFTDFQLVEDAEC